MLRRSLNNCGLRSFLLVFLLLPLLLIGGAAEAFEATAEDVKVAEDTETYAGPQVLTVQQVYMVLLYAGWDPDVARYEALSVIEIETGSRWDNSMVSPAHAECLFQIQWDFDMREEDAFAIFSEKGFVQGWYWTFHFTQGFEGSVTDPVDCARLGLLIYERDIALGNDGWRQWVAKPMGRRYDVVDPETRVVPVGPSSLCKSGCLDLM